MILRPEIRDLIDALGARLRFCGLKNAALRQEVADKEQWAGQMRDLLLDANEKVRAPVAEARRRCRRPFCAP